eukprot:348586-Rhodomonas_salina.6
MVNCVPGVWFLVFENEVQECAFWYLACDFAMSGIDVVHWGRAAGSGEASVQGANAGGQVCDVT